MIKFAFLFFILLFSISGSGKVFGQPSITNAGEWVSIPDRELAKLQTDYINNLYYKEIATPKDIINGKECLPYSFRSETTPMFFSREKLIATLNVNNRVYKNIKIQYDTFLDELIYTDTSRIINSEFPRIDLNKDNISTFSVTVSGAVINFRNMAFSENQGTKMADGFYESVYEGQTRLIIRHRSTLYNKQGMNEYKYSAEKYVFAGNKYNKLKNNKSLLILLSDRSEAMKSYLHNSRIRVNKAGKEQIVEVLKYYDSLKASERNLQ